MAICNLTVLANTNIIVLITMKYYCKDLLN